MPGSQENLRQAIDMGAKDTANYEELACRCKQKLLEVLLRQRSGSMESSTEREEATWLGWSGCLTGEG